MNQKRSLIETRLHERALPLPAVARGVIVPSTPQAVVAKAVSKNPVFGLRQYLNQVRLKSQEQKKKAVARWWGGGKGGLVRGVNRIGGTCSVFSTKFNESLR